MKNIAIFASGSGTNAQNLIEYFNRTKDSGLNNNSLEKGAKVVAVICNRPDAYVLTRAEKLNVPSVVMQKEELTANPKNLLALLRQLSVDYIILAGYLLKIPAELIHEYPDRIINIHPALLPAYGGKGMYGHHVHEAVVAAGEKESGITIHLVDEKYDNGNILFQARCKIAPADTPDDVAAKVHELEQAHFPQIVEQYISEYKVRK